MNTKNNHSIPGRFRLGLATSVLIGCGCLVGCAPKHAPNPPVHLLIGFDTSASWTPHLADCARLSARLASGLDPDRDRFTAFRVDRALGEFLDGPVPDSEDSLQAVFVRELGAKPSGSGTLPAPF